MGFDLVGFSEAAPGTGVVGITRAANDKIYAEPGGDDIRIKSRAAYLLGLLYAAETTPDNARIRQSSRLQDLQFTRGVDLNDLDSLPGFHNYFKNPIMLRVGETARCLSENATDEDTIIAWFLAGGKFPEPASPTHIIKAEADQTLTANTWTQCGTLTYDQDLPDGSYYIVGMKCGVYTAGTYMATIARLIIDKSPWRPGVVCMNSEADKTSLMSAYPAPWENWGLQRDLIFHSKSMPQLELLSPAANTDHVLELAVQALDREDIGNLNPD